MVVREIAANLILPIPVLLLEDDPIVYRRIEALLVAMGYDKSGIVYASSLAQARQILAEISIALALVDIGLPDGNGIKLMGLTPNIVI